MQAERLWEIRWIVVLIIASLQCVGLGQNHVSVDFMTSYIYETRQVESIASDQELIGYTEADTSLYNSKDLMGDVVHSPTLVYSSSKPITWVSYREYLTPPYRWEFPDLEEDRSYWVAAGYTPPAGDVNFKLGCDVDYAVDKVEFKAPGGKQTVKLTLEPKDWNLMVLGKLELWVGVEETDEVVPRIVSIEASRGDTWLDPQGKGAWWNSGKGPGGKYEVEVVIDVEVKEGHELVRFLPTVDVQVKLSQGRGKEGLKKGLAREAKTGIGRWEWEAGKPCVWEWEEWVRKVVRYEGISAPGFRPPTSDAVEAAIEKGLAWLTSAQNPDGSWNYCNVGWRGWEEPTPNVGVTALAALALLLHGYSEDNPTVAKAVHYILSRQAPNGYFCSEEHCLPTYETSFAVLALVATGNPEYADEIAKARNWLIESQHNEEEPYRYGLSCNNPEECWAYGGWGYGYRDTRNQDECVPDLVPYLWADLSNTQFALMALEAAGLPPDSKVWKRAEDFVSRCQNLDGGFNYMPPWEGRSRRAWEGGKSYGSMTAAGIWCLRLCGVPVEDARIQKGLEWLRRFYSYWDNPFLEETFHYYYLWTVTRAFLYSDLPGVLEPAPPLEGWYWDFAGYLVEMQQGDGSWISTDKEREPPELATCFALLSLGKATLPKPFGP